MRESLQALNPALTLGWALDSKLSLFPGQKHCSLSHPLSITANSSFPKRWDPRAEQGRKQKHQLAQLHSGGGFQKLPFPNRKAEAGAQVWRAESEESFLTLRRGWEAKNPSVAQRSALGVLGVLWDPKHSQQGSLPSPSHKPHCRHIPTAPQSCIRTYKWSWVTCCSRKGSLSWGAPITFSGHLCTFLVAHKIDFMHSALSPGPSWARIFVLSCHLEWLLALTVCSWEPLAIRAPSLMRIKENITTCPALIASLSEENQHIVPNSRKILNTFYLN